MKVATILGARPQFVKAATVSRQFQKNEIDEVLIHTGQHFDANMSQVFFDEMEISCPNYNLEISGLNHGAMTGRMLEKIEPILLNEMPDYVLVYGDTNSTLAGALAAAKLHIPIAHVEAGLRSFETKMPEEINRILTDRISEILFCPTQTAVDNLVKEGFVYFNSQIEKPGDVMYDAVLYYQNKAEQTSTILDINKWKSGQFVLCTIHRAENTNDPIRLKSICDAFNEIHKSTPVVLPLHPRTKSYLQSLNIKMNVHIIEPIGYFDMLMLLKHCSLVMTDSGGLQKEAFFFKKYCITLRNQTEWVELIKVGANRLAGANKKLILESYHELSGADFTISENLYGLGNAAELIAQKLKNR